MGRIFLDHIGGTRLFSCANCDTILTNRSELISTRFTGATGRAFLFNKVRKPRCSPPATKMKRATVIQHPDQRIDLCLHSPTGGEPPVQRGAGPSDADRQTHGEGRQLQELQQQVGLDLRVCDGGQSALQRGARHPGEGAGQGERGLRGARPLRQLVSPSPRIT
uniref:Yippee domain-containing protein n=1 Tax=Gasterosteus aculeatus aculeatus TaxID=481459 RepID=A0AAQ4RWU9_GASAC